LLSVPSLILAVVSVIVQIVQNSTGNTDLSYISNVLFIIGLAVIVIAIVLLAFLAYKRRSEIVRALSFGICIAVILCVLELFVLGWLAGDF
jgi:heme/copper-type cytochrome/quinol oxidase subunit 4